MAAASINVSTQKLEDLLKCRICIDTIQRPKAFDCLHFFCQTCIDALPPKRGNPRLNPVLECPLCRNETRKNEMRSMFFIGELLEIVELLKKDQQYCDKCKDKPATHRCVDCKTHFCQDCKTIHDGFDFMKHHAWEHVVEGATPKIDRHVYCSKHQGKIAELYCKPCNELICFLCKSTQHDSHQGETIDDAIQRLLPGVQQQQNLVREKIAQTERDASKLKTDKKRVEDKYAAIEKQIDERVEELIRKARADGRKLKDALAEKRAKQLAEMATCNTSLDQQLDSQRTIAAIVESTLTSLGGASLLQALQLGVRESLEAQVEQRQEPCDYSSDVTVRFSPCANERTNAIGSMENIQPNAAAKMISVRPRTSAGRQVVDGNASRVIHRFSDIVRIRERRTHNLEHKVFRFAKFNTALWIIECAKPSKLHIYSMDVTKKNTILLNGIEYCYAIAHLDQHILLAARNGLFIMSMDGGNQVQLMREYIFDVAVFQDKVYILNNSNGKLQILKLNADRASVTQESEFAIIDYNCNYSNTIQVTPLYIFIAIAGTHKIYQHRHDGTLVASHGLCGSGLDQLSGPYLCGADDTGTVLMADRNNNHLKTLTSDGQWRCLDVQQGLRLPFWSVVHDNSLFVREYNGKELKEFVIDYNG